MPSEINFPAAMPILRVQSHSVSLHHYVRVLGFKMDWNVYEAEFASGDACVDEILRRRGRIG